MEVLFQFLLGFTIAFSGAILPGPLLVGVIRSTLKNGKRTGFFASIGHIIAETFFIIAIFIGLRAILISEKAQTTIGLLGGTFLLIFGISTIYESQKVKNFNLEDKKAVHSGIKTGITFTLFNPMFSIWWLTIGFTMLTNAYYNTSFLGAILWVIGSYFADIFWFSLVSIMIFSKKSIIGKKPHIILTAILGIILEIIGIIFILKNI